MSIGRRSGRVIGGGGKIRAAGEVVGLMLPMHRRVIPGADR